MWRTKRSTEKSRFRPSDGCRGPKGRGSRCEAARAAIRFGGQAREDVLKCTIAPGICPEGGPEVGLISLFFLSVSFPLFPFPLRFPPQLRRNPGGLAVNLILWSSTFKTNTEACKKLRNLGNTLRNPGLRPSGFRTFGATGRYFLFYVSEPLAFWKSGVACAYQPRLSRRVRRCVAL